MKAHVPIIIAAVALVVAAGAYKRTRIELEDTLDRSEFVHIRDTAGFNWTVKRADIFRVEPGFLVPTTIVVRLSNPERAIIVSQQTRSMVDMLLK